MAALLAAVLAAVLVLGVAVAIFAGLAVRRADGLEELGVKPVYPRALVPTAKIEAYLELKEKLRGQYGKGSQSDEAWMSQLPAQAKELLKYRLMQRAIGGIAALQKIDADARGYWRLFSKGVITRRYWNSVVEAEREISDELEEVKTEAACVEPTQDPRGIVSEAMRFVVQYGDRAPSPEDVVSPDALADVIKSLPGAGALPGLAGLPGLPPGMPPGLPRGAVPPVPLGPHGSTQPQPSPQDESASDCYRWKQDTDEVEVSVIVPDSAVKSEVKVAIQARALRVVHKGQALVDGQLASACSPEGSTWTLGKGRVTVSLEKRDPRPWPALFAPKSLPS